MVSRDDKKDNGATNSKNKKRVTDHNQTVQRKEKKKQLMDIIEMILKTGQR